MKIEISPEQFNYLVAQADAIDDRLPEDPYAAIFDIADRIVNRKTIGMGKRPKQTMREFWDINTEAGKRNNTIALELAKDDATIYDIAKKLEVSYNLVTRVKDTVVLIQKARLAGQPMPKYPAPSSKYKLKASKN